MTIEEQINESIKTKQKILKSVFFVDQIKKMARVLVETIESDHKVLVAGNGGSAADAQHFAAELVGRFLRKRKGYPVIALTTDGSFLTAWGNDDSFDNIFSRQIQALSQPGDAFVGISTSGKSINIVNAFKTAEEMGLETVALLGNDGGIIKGIINNALIVPSKSTPRIQESHIMVIHLICDLMESSLSL